MSKKTEQNTTHEHEVVKQEAELSDEVLQQANGGAYDLKSTKKDQPFTLNELLVII